MKMCQLILASRGNNLESYKPRYDKSLLLNENDEND